MYENRESTSNPKGHPMLMRRVSWDSTSGTHGTIRREFATGVHTNARHTRRESRHRNSKTWTYYRYTIFAVATGGFITGAIITLAETIGR